MIGAPLKDLGLTQTNAGTWSGVGGWLDDASAKIIESVNPATGEVIARVRATTPAQYEQVMASAVVAAKAWRTVPAPKRGEAVRLMGEELRKYKSKLGSLVSLEMGKIKPEGDGEVQEMIDIADFAVGQSRMLYGVLDFADQTAAQVMTPRPDIISLQADRPLREALDLALTHRHRRLPVYGENDDDIVGVLYLKDAMRRMYDNPRAQATETVESLMRPPTFCPDSKPVDELLREMQLTRSHVVIVVDEFAALVSEVPEFVDGVVNIAQRGRSLGLHLILATQRPAGVIKDNLRANTNLRVALRMADEADSTDVVGTPLAADFDASLPGRGIAKTGPGRLTSFQSAYVGGWTTRQPSKPMILVAEFPFGSGASWDEPDNVVAAPETATGPNDIRRVVANITATATSLSLPASRRPWLPDLAPTYRLEALPTERNDTELIFGVADVPTDQAQPVVGFLPDRDGNMAVFGTGGSGKSSFLRSLAVAAGFAPARGGPVTVYAFDFGSRGLQMLEGLPHVAAVATSDDHERIVRVLKQLRSTIDERALRFAAVSAVNRSEGVAQVPVAAIGQSVVVAVGGEDGAPQAFERWDPRTGARAPLWQGAAGQQDIVLASSGDWLATVRTGLALPFPEWQLILRNATTGEARTIARNEGTVADAPAETVATAQAGSALRHGHE